MDNLEDLGQSKYGKKDFGGKKIIFMYIFSRGLRGFIPSFLLADEAVPEKIQLNIECKYPQIFLEIFIFLSVIIAGNLLHCDNWTTDWVPASSLHLPVDIRHVPHLSVQQYNVSVLPPPSQ